ncbi:adenine methyltransferase [Nocardia gipuzkoensis]|uniref:adenine methyltransferase n=1 Tax=Nocardia gipuzkoensis TaxID=2749991 RepID=UPI00237EDE04|nr:adenine methyltransferase [Nocardia gipuzkoensis]MDE1672645.1 adenine methyltransferase [Nocardia gipuzkoensis]
MSSGLGIGGHASARAGSHVWLTPPGLLAALGPFDLDPAAAPAPRPWDTAAVHIAPPEDGLAVPWRGRVFLNPPYGREVGRWLGALADHGVGTALVFARTETDWFIEHVWQRATSVLFLHGRLHFYRPDGSRAPANSGGPSCLVAYGEDDSAALRDCGIAGTLLRLRETVGGSRPEAIWSNPAGRPRRPGGSLVRWQHNTFDLLGQQR